MQKFKRNESKTLDLSELDLSDQPSIEQLVKKTKGLSFNKMNTLKKPPLKRSVAVQKPKQPPKKTFSRKRKFSDFLRQPEAPGLPPSIDTGCLAFEDAQMAIEFKRFIYGK